MKHKHLSSFLFLIINIHITAAATTSANAAATGTSANAAATGTSANAATTGISANAVATTQANVPATTADGSSPTTAAVTRPADSTTGLSACNPGDCQNGGTCNDNGLG